MNPKSTGQIRRSQIITTYGPGSLIDLPRDSAIVAGIDGWTGRWNGSRSLGLSAPCHA